jgi:hypothetical protein
MSTEIVKQIIALLLGGFLGVVFKYWFDFRGMVFKELWTKRYDTYKKMFLLTGIMPQYRQHSKVSYEGLLKRSEEMRDWFFEDGGLLLSTKTRNKYFKVQKRIQKVLESAPAESQHEITIEYEDIRNLLSQLRRTMAVDLMSRNRM